MSGGKQPKAVVAFGANGLELCMGTVNVTKSETMPILMIGFKVNNTIQFLGCLTPEAANIVELALSDFRRFIEVNYGILDDNEIDPDDIKYLSEENEEEE